MYKKRCLPVSLFTVSPYDDLLMPKVIKYLKEITAFL